MNLGAAIRLMTNEIASILSCNKPTVYLYGSVVLDDFKIGWSDIDILVDFAPDVSLFDHAALMEELESALGRKVDVVSEHGLRPRMRERVLKEAVPL